jgi:hypothetical protein
MDNSDSSTNRIIASYSDALYISRRPRSHPAQSNFFVPVIAQVSFGHRLLVIRFLTIEINDFVSIGLANCINREPLLAGFQKVLAPAVIQVGINALPAMVCIVDCSSVFLLCSNYKPEVSTRPGEVHTPSRDHGVNFLNASKALAFGLSRQ